MAVYKQVHTVLGVISIAIAGLLNVGWLRSFGFLVVKRVQDIWAWTNLFPVLGLIIFLALIGANELQRGRGHPVTKPRIRWGRLLAGFWIAYFALKSHFAPDPGSLKADNASEAAGMMLATVLMVVAGVLLMLFAFKPRKQHAPSVVENSAGAPR